LFYWTIFHIFGHLWEPILLFIWIFVFGFRHPGRLMQSDQYCHGIFSTMFWKLSLVVEEFFRLWWFSHLRFCLFRLLFLYQIGYWWICSNFVIFLLHAYDGSDFLAPYGNNWILCSLLFYQKDLCCCQDRLMKQYYYYYNDDYCVYILGLNHVYFVPNIFFFMFSF